MIDGGLELAPGRISAGDVLQGSSQRGEQAALELFEAIDRHGIGSLALTGEGAARRGALRWSRSDATRSLLA